MHSTRFMIDFQLSVSRVLQTMTRTQQLNFQATSPCDAYQRGLSCGDVQSQVSKRRLMHDTGWANEYNCGTTAFHRKL